MNDEMALFLAALDHDGPARERLVAAIADAPLQQRVRALLAAHQDLGDTEPVPLLPRGPAELPAGAELDGFVIVRVVGRGGMGVVYEAEQRSPRRRVALKTLPADSGADGARRLAQEARLLARLTHPGIAQVHGIGRAAALGDTPFLVLEFVDGKTLDRFVAERQPPTRARLHLLAAIAEAVAHAHARGVVHRDLKPGNVLVDAAGAPKVLDFGIARLAARDGVHAADSAVLQTRPGQVLGTLPYMAPEQFGNDPDAIDVRTDVYALGVVAYQLLTGRLPFDVAGMSLATAARHICEHEPPAPSRLHRHLRGDLDLVVGKAIAKEPGQRYASAAELAADLRRLLAGEPVLAHPPSRVYRLRKLVARHRAVAAALLAGFLALAMGLVLTEHARQDALQAGERAERAAARETQRARAARRLGGILKEIVDQTTPQRHGGQPPAIAEVIDDLETSFDAWVGDDPWVRARVHLFLAGARHQAGAQGDAAAHLDLAAAAFARSELTDDRDRAELELAEARRLLAEGQRAAAITAFRRAQSLARATTDASLEELAATHELAGALSLLPGHLAEAQGHADRATALAIARHGAGSALHASTLHTQALLLTRGDRLPEAIALHEQVVGIRRQLAPASLALATALQNLAHARQLAARLDDALVACREALAIQRRVHGDRPHRDLAFSLDVEGSLLRDLGRLEESLPCFAEAERLFVAAGGDEHPDVAVCLTEWGIALDRLGRRADAVDKLQRALAIRRGHDDSGSPELAATLEALATARTGTQPYDDVAALAEEALAIRRRVHGARHALVGRALETLGTVQLFGERYADCEATGRELLALRQAVFGEEHWSAWSCAAMLWVPLARRGAYDEGIAIAARAAAILERELGAANARVRHALEAQRDLEQLAGRTAAAATTTARLQALPAGAR